LSRLIYTFNALDFTITTKEIKNTINKTKFVFKGLKDDTALASLKSLDNVLICWVEEAQAITDRDIDILIPTIRGNDILKKTPQFYFSYNRMMQSDPIHKYLLKRIDYQKDLMFEDNDGKIYEWSYFSGKDIDMIEINYNGNPFFPETLRQEMLICKENDYEKYLWIWKNQPFTQDINSLIKRHFIQKSINKSSPQTDGKESVGCDIASMGNDENVFIKRKGNRVINVQSISAVDIQSIERISNKKSTLIIADKIKEFVKFDKSILINIDDTGVGGGVTDVLLTEGYNVTPINFGSSPKDKDKYPNKRAEMWCEFADQVNDEIICLPNHQKLIEDLETVKYYYDTKQRRCIVPKELHKKEIGRSPDYGDACILAFYVPPIIEPILYNRQFSVSF
ncbi:MAG TPA: phage terminase large subunit, partial [Spirochaetota bacterium]|nr:phage terminase large subunit [Spirochaetota bacterium]